MDFIKGHRIEELQDGCNVILYLDQNFTEFSKELDPDYIKANQTDHNIKAYVKNRFPNKNVKKVKVFLGSLLVMTFALGTADHEAFAAENQVASNHTVVQDPNQSYTVVSGDTLSVIAKKYKTTVNAIKRVNNLSSDMIFVGQRLTIPNSNLNPQTVSYHVQSGDSLSLIAKNYNTTVEQLKSTNSLTSEVIYVGQTLLIPDVEQVPKNQTSNSTTHTVVAGDTLSGLAKRYQTSVDQLMATNNLSSSTIYVGQEIQLPSVGETPQPIQQEPGIHTVKAGDTLSEIAKQYNVTVQQIKQTNNLTGNTIYVGQTLSITPSEINETPAPTNPSLLFQGLKGEQVESLQNNLKTLGFFYDSVTGYYGDVTEHAVRSFQHAYGLNVTGSVDGNTQTQIDKALVKQRLIADTANFTGVPYVWGGTTPSGFDCSGFVYYMFNSHGVDMARSTSSALFNQGIKINRSDLQPGDLVYFAVNQPGVISHVGFYTGENTFVSATSSKGIWEYSMDNSYWSQYYVGANRIY